MNKIEINEEFLKIPLEEFKARMLRENKEILNVYEDNFESLSLTHELYRYNWRVNFLDDHRYMNWVVYTLLRNAKQGSRPLLFNHSVLRKDFTVLDIGCYDSCLVRILNDNKIRAYGFDDNNWSDMFSLMGTKKLIGVENTKADIAVILNYAHNFHPNDLIKFVEEKCGAPPSIVFFDFDTRVAHNHQRKYYDRDDYNIVNFDCRDERELFVYAR